MKQMLIINSQQALDKHVNTICDLWHENKWLRLEVDTDKQRSGLQNSALHKYLTLLANALNESGQELIIIINGKQSEVPWTMETVKDLMWRPIQKAITKQKSSTKCSTTDYLVIYETLNRHTAEKLGVFVPWPSKETM